METAYPPLGSSPVRFCVLRNTLLATMVPLALFAFGMCERLEYDKEEKLPRKSYQENDVREPAFDLSRLKVRGIVT